MVPGEFLQTVKRRLHLLLSTQDGSFDTVNNWVIKEASNIDALQEGGTFRYFFSPTEDNVYIRVRLFDTYWSWQAHPMEACSGGGSAIIGASGLSY